VNAAAGGAFSVSPSQRDGRVDFMLSLLVMAWFVVLSLSLITTTTTLVANEFFLLEPSREISQKEEKLCYLDRGRIQMGFLIGSKWLLGLVWGPFVEDHTTTKSERRHD
jgi:hypothetical protein